MSETKCVSSSRDRADIKPPAALVDIPDLRIMLTLPPLEVLYQICGLVVAEFLDAVIAGRFRYSPPTRPLESSDPYDDPAFTAENPIVALLRTSLRIRQATLLVVSDALCIPIDETGVVK